MGTYTGLSLDDAVALAGARLDEIFEESLVQQRDLMRRCGLSREDMKLLIDLQIKSYQADRDEQLDGVRARMIAVSNMRLH